MSDKNGLLLLWKAAEQIEGSDMENLIIQARNRRNSYKMLKSRDSSMQNGKKAQIPIRHSHNELEKCRRAHLRSCMEKLKKVLKFDQDSSQSRVTMLSILKKATITIRNREKGIHAVNQKETMAKNRFVELTNRLNNLQRQLKRLKNMQSINANGNASTAINSYNGTNHNHFCNANSNSNDINSSNSTVNCISSNNISNGNIENYNHSHSINFIESLVTSPASTAITSVAAMKAADRIRNYSECSILTTSSDESNGDSKGRSRQVSSSFSGFSDNCSMVNYHQMSPVKFRHKLNNSDILKSSAGNFELSKLSVNGKPINHNLVLTLNKGNTNKNIGFVTAEANSKTLYNKCSSPNSNSCDSGFEESNTGNGAGVGIGGVAGTALSHHHQSTKQPPSLLGSNLKSFHTQEQRTNISYLIMNNQMKPNVDEFEEEDYEEDEVGMEMNVAHGANTNEDDYEMFTICC